MRGWTSSFLYSFLIKLCCYSTEGHIILFGDIEVIFGGNEFQRFDKEQSLYVSQTSSTMYMERGNR